MNKVLNRCWLALIAVAAMMLLLPAVTMADSVFVEFSTDTFLINPDSNNVRSLVRFDLPAELDSTDIVFAELTLPINCDIPDSSAFALFCNPLNIAWNVDDITWHTLGDTLTDLIIGDGTLFVTSSQGDQTAYFDITAIVRLWAEGSLINNGLILSYDNSQAAYPIFDYDAGLNGQVRIIYSKLE